MAKTVGFFTDVTLCIGCKACEVACKEWNQLPGHAPQFRDSFDNTGRLDDQNWRHVKFVEWERPGKGLAWTMMSDVCKHCALASCMEVCPTNAIIRTEFDTVYIQPSVCNGCRDCIAACPYNVIGYSETTGVAQKCTFCYSRLQNNLMPACAKACPTQSIKFGYRDELAAVARKRVEELKKQGYEAQLYGEDQNGALGGLNAFFLITGKPSMYGLPENPKLPQRNVFVDSLLSIGSAIAVGIGAVVAFRSRGGKEEN